MKKKQIAGRDKVETMFDSIADHYDFLNRLLSFGTDIYWRRKAISIIKKSFRPSFILDVACGTGDFAEEAAGLSPEKITGVDISDRMLEKGRRKIERKKLSGKIELLKGDSESLPFEDDRFDLVMCAFGVRNFSDRMKGLREMSRVLRNEGMVAILEFSKPKGKIFGRIFEIYFFSVLPVVGRLVSGDPTAYKYLPESVYDFPSPEEFSGMMDIAGFSEIQTCSFSGGIVTFYTGSKKKQK